MNGTSIRQVKKGEKLMLDMLSGLMEIWIMALVIWRISCLFRKRGACKFRGCPFRKKYTDTSFMGALECGCMKCPPTEEERMIYERTPDGILEYLDSKDGAY